MVEQLCLRREFTIDKIKDRLAFANATERDLVEASLISFAEFAITLCQIKYDARCRPEELTSKMAWQLQGFYDAVELNG